MIDLSFPHHWQATILARRPLIAPPRHFVYPQEVEEVERGALEVLIKPEQAPGNQQAFLATFALGFADPSVPTGIWSCPDPGQLCAVAGGYAYLVQTADPQQWTLIEYRPVLAVTPLPSQRLLLFSGHQSIVAYGPAGMVWQTGRLSWEGFTIRKIEEETLTGLGWDLMTDQDYEFHLNLLTGEHVRLG